ncbi:protein PHYTOCHROME KINASE SUBSTRATE 3-like [Andrographis paniculata]|uniref:protein PHYTOCHROME KINASE SUBSTRATE 3-like n=1 Tax=Andrographis paniculata TaxID=175694 RepID=UPI0021E99659|nr:protein PHYTOCHROME KINASE SUBSTRATE 3-like [Andrographis paniculata]
MDSDDCATSLRVASFACYLDTAKDTTVQDTPPFTIKFSGAGSSHLRVDSFSYNLAAAAVDNNFVFEVPGPIQDPTAAFTFSHHDIPKDGGEISVFGAHKYFNTIPGNHPDRDHHHRRRRMTAANPLPEVHPGSPSRQSEASSWNSRSALIVPEADVIKSRNQCNTNKPRRTFGRRIFTGFGCKGPCFAKKSIHVSEAADGAKPAQIPDDPRQSIEVFGGAAAKPTKSKGLSKNIAANMERQLSMLTWDAIPTTTPTVATAAADDMASEASSDLFEIENISGAAAAGIMSPASQYAPSEASIQWSVVTASAADYSTVVSDHYNGETPAPANLMNNNKEKNGGMVVRNRGAERGRGGGLLGCKNVKSVDEKSQEIRTKTSLLDFDLDINLFGKSHLQGINRMKIDHIDIKPPYTKHP